MSLPAATTYSKVHGYDLKKNSTLTFLIVGKIMNLARPLVLSERVNLNGEQQMVIKGVMRKKILFSTRPTPLRL